MCVWLTGCVGGEASEHAWVGGQPVNAHEQPAYKQTRICFILVEVQDWPIVQCVANGDPPWAGLEERLTYWSQSTLCTEPRQELNGLVGHLLKFDTVKLRWGVELENGKKVSLKMGNFVPARAVLLDSRWRLDGMYQLFCCWLERVVLKRKYKSRHITPQKGTSTTTNTSASASACVRTREHTHTHRDTCMHACMHACMHTYIHCIR